MNENKPACILVIDNDEHVTQAITHRLTNHGYHCMTANNGEEGLSEYSLCEVDLIITDLNMPVLDGVEFVERVRATSSTPVIIVTGYSDQYRHRIRKIPHVTVVQKPFETQALLDLIEIELTQQSDAPSC